MFTIRREFLDDIAGQPQAERIHQLRHALLVLHSPTDETVGVENAHEILDAARHPKSFIAIDGADHLLTDRAGARYAAIMLAAWADRYTRGPVGAGPGGIEGGPERGASDSGPTRHRQDRAGDGAGYAP